LRNRKGEVLCTNTAAAGKICEETRRGKKKPLSGREEGWEKRGKTAIEGAEAFYRRCQGISLLSSRTKLRISATGKTREKWTDRSREK